MRVSTKDDGKVNKKRESEVAQEKSGFPQTKDLSIGSIKYGPTQKAAPGAGNASNGGGPSADGFPTKRFRKRRTYNEKGVQPARRKKAQKSIFAAKGKPDPSDPLSVSTKQKMEAKNKETVFQNTAASANKGTQSKASGVNFKENPQVTKAETPITTSSAGTALKAAKKAGEAAKEKAQDAKKNMQQNAKAQQAPEGQDNVQKVVGTVKKTLNAVISAILLVISILLAPVVTVTIILIAVVVVVVIVVLLVAWLVGVLFSWLTTQEVDMDASVYNNLSYIYSFFSERDYGDTQIAAIMGNLYAELSTIDPTYDDGYVLGIMQWTGSNRDAIIEWCEDNGYGVYTLEGQCGYMDQAFLEGTWNFADYTGDAAYPSVYDITYEEWLGLDGDDIALAAGAFCACAERPYYYNSHLEETRIPMAEYYLELIQSGYFVTVTSDIAYVQYALDMAYDDSIGYSQTNRLRNPDVDCSSFVAFALKDAGYSITPSTFSTRSAASVLTRLGFEELSFSSKYNLLPGDILLRSGHMEIYIGNYLMVGAHSSTINGVGYPEGGDQTGQEVSVTLVSEDWTKVYRLPVLG